MVSVFRTFLIFNLIMLSEVNVLSKEIYVSEFAYLVLEEKEPCLYKVEVQDYSNSHEYRSSEIMINLIFSRPNKRGYQRANFYTNENIGDKEIRDSPKFSKAINLIDARGVKTYRQGILYFTLAEATTGIEATIEAGKRNKKLQKLTAEENAIDVDKGIAWD